MTVLVADDSATNRCLLRALLESDGHAVVEACDGREALARLLVGDPPDVAIIDWEMPEFDGIDVVRRAREQLQSYVYLLILTLRDSQSDRDTALQAGADGFITKPIDFAELLSKVSEGLQRVQQSRAARP